MDVEATFTGGDGGGDGEAPTTGRPARSTRSSMSSAGTPAASRASPVAQMPRRKRRISACGKPVCGVRDGEGDDSQKCWACDEGPRLTGGTRQSWRHFQSDADVETARETWAEMMARGADRGRVKDGREPWKDCFCTRADCMFLLVQKWQEMEAVRTGEEAEPNCKICGIRGKSTSRMRSPGPHLHVFRSFFTRRDPNHPVRIPLGSTLQSGSRLCQGCYMKGYRFSKSMGVRDRLCVREELEMATASEPPARWSVDKAK